ncbi:armadillo repeat-containing protein 3 [Conger conger]|uniref:armadillo repeat-containing protein 3 n=1 Tax=Conger conger TaxID=82655 RepID=UPI002A5A4112|nr:armadillo repeat-containing protein 3 [Conger conger]XP_061096445.1 armadillo repeat-containing protein 3 [Conger conger]
MGKKVKKETETPVKDVFDPLPIESKKPATVVLMLSSPEEDILAKACEAIYKYAEKGDENKSTLVGLGAVEPLSQLISHQDQLVRRNAFMALGVMAANSDVKRLLVKLGIFPSIIAKLSPEEDVVVHEFATLCLVSLSVEFTCKVKIFESDGLDPLIKLLTSPDPDVKKNSVECIYNLVQDFPSRMAVRELNGIPPLLELLNSEFPIIQQLALRTLESITTDTATRAAFREEQGLDRLLELLANEELSDLHMEALQVISNCLQDSEAMGLIQETGGLEKLLQVIVKPVSPEVQMNAATAISRAAQNSENKRILHEHNVEKALVSMLAVDHDGVRTATCRTVAAMSENLACRDTFRHLEGIRPIVLLLSSESAEVREAAALALTSLTSSNQLNAYAVYEAEGDKFLVQLLQDRCQGAVAHAAAVLTNMAAQEALRCSALAHGAIRALVEPLRAANTRVAASTTLAVAALVCDAEGRADLRDAGGLAPLIKLLNSNNAEVRSNACWAVRVCASDEPTAIEMCKLGALEILQEVNSSPNRQSKFSEAALQRLLDSNLSVKYSLAGYLSSTNITVDGFYDPGKAHAGQRVLTLEELSKQEVNQHRPVIAVNGKPEQLVSVDLPEDKQQDSLVPTRSSSVLSKSSSKTLCRAKSRRKEDEKQKDEEESRAVEAAVEKPWAPPYDVEFQDLVTEAAKTVLPLRDEREQCIVLAQLVSDSMGGAVDREKLHHFLWELHLSELKLELQSNVIPIGKIRKGTFYHRALLFKALADRIGVSCSLVRGDYNRAWNEVRLMESPLKAPGRYPQPRTYVVDLLHTPGNLLRSDSPAAIQYQTI